MPRPSIPAANGLRVLLGKALAAGGQLVDGCLYLPPSVGTGFIKLVAVEPGVLVAIHRYDLVEEIVLERLAEANRAERLLVSFQSFGPALPTAQLAFTTIAFCMY